MVSIPITILNANRPPVIAPIINQTVNRGSALDVVVSTSDPDGNPLILTASGLPDFAIFKDNGNGTATLTLNPVAGDVAGSPYTVRIGVTDGIDSDYEDVSITVTYTPEDDPVNGQPNGANPVWVILTMPDSSEVRSCFCGGRMVK